MNEDVDWARVRREAAELLDRQQAVVSALTDWTTGWETNPDRCPPPDVNGRCGTVVGIRRCALDVGHDGGCRTLVSTR